MKILIADDDRVTTLTIAGRLKAAGHQTAIAFDAMQVGMAMTKAAPDVVLLDINMPGETGIHALQRIKASSNSSHIPVIIVTGSTDPDLPSRVKELGAEGLLSKPVDFTKLEELLKGLSRDGQVAQG